MIDEEAIERFGRDLDDADLAARVLTEDQDAQDEDEDDEEDAAIAADTAASAVPRRPISHGAREDPVLDDSARQHAGREPRAP